LHIIYIFFVNWDEKAVGSEVKWGGRNISREGKAGGEDSFP